MPGLPPTDGTRLARGAILLVEGERIVNVEAGWTDVPDGMLVRDYPGGGTFPSGVPELACERGGTLLRAAMQAAHERSRAAREAWPSEPRTLRR